MKTLSDNLRHKLKGRNVAPLIELLGVYDDEKDVAKCYSTFAYLSCAGAGGSQGLAETMAVLDSCTHRCASEVKTSRNAPPMTHLPL